MSSGLERKAERLTKLLEKLATESSRGALIVVEGRNDVEALRQLAVEGNVISAKTYGKNFQDVVNEIESQTTTRGIIVLLDFDRRGTEWVKRLKQHLEEKRIKVNTNLWNELRRLVGRDIKDIEGLPTYLETLGKKIENR